MKKTIFFIMPNLGGGGGERVISILLNNVDRLLYKPSLVILKANGSNEFLKDLNKDIAIHYLGVKSRIKIAFPIVIYKTLKLCKKEEPDILFFGSGQINALFSPFLCLFPKNIKLIARESNIPSQFEKYFLVKMLYRYTYNNYNDIIVQSDDMFNDLNLNFKIPKHKLNKLNNPVDFKYIERRKKEGEHIELSKGKIKLLSAGRLTHQKGFDLLINELFKIKNLDFHLYILGDGEEKDNLMNLSQKYKLKDRISFIGNVDNPYKYMEKADVFILSSRYEGFPNVVLESLSCGTPVLANNCLGGINEIIKPGFNGLVFDFSNDEFNSKLNDILKLRFNKEEIIKDINYRFSVENKVIEFQKIFNRK